MPSIELTDEELQGFVQLCATASGPGINWVLTNALLTKARQAQERQQANIAAAAHTTAAAHPIDDGTVGPANHPPRYGVAGLNSEDHDAKAGV